MNIESTASTEIQSLRSQHATVSYLALAVMALVVLLAGWWTLRTMRSYEALLARAEQRFEDFQARMDQREKDWLAHERERDQATAQQRTIERTIEIRDSATARQVAAVTAPSRTAAQVASAAASILGAAPTLPAGGPLPAGGLLCFTPPQVQAFEATRLERDQYRADLGDVRQTLALEQGKTASLTADLGVARQSLNESAQVISAYRRVAKKTRWQKVLGVLYDAGKVGFGVVLGRAAR